MRKLFVEFCTEIAEGNVEEKTGGEKRAEERRRHERAERRDEERRRKQLEVAEKTGNCPGKCSGEDRG